MTTITKVRMEYDDGTTIEFLGKDAEEWLSAVTNACVVAQIHGMNDPLNEFWKKHLGLR